MRSHYLLTLSSILILACNSSSPQSPANDGSAKPGTTRMDGGTEVRGTGGSTAPAVGGAVPLGDAGVGTGGTAAVTGGVPSGSGGVVATGGNRLSTGGTIGAGGTPMVTGGVANTGGSKPLTGGTNTTGGQSTNKDAGTMEAPPSDLRPGDSQATADTASPSDTKPPTADSSIPAPDTKPSTDGGLTAGNPNGSCSAGVPARGQLVNTAVPTTVVGTGTEASCTFARLQTAVAAGGIITFDCGPTAVTIRVTATLVAPVNKDTVIDGKGTITLDGGKAVQILRFDSPNFTATTFGLTVQRLTFVNGKATPTVAIPPAPAPCSQGWDDGQGGAIYVRDGSLTVIDSIFMNNTAADIGPDTGGGAIYVLGSKNGVFIVGSTFMNNSASNAGAVGGLFAELNVYNSLFSSNTALGRGANGISQEQCPVDRGDGNFNIGSGGNGGAVYSDGISRNVTLCGDAILNNHAGDDAYGGGIFFTSNDYGGTLTITDTTITGNSGGSWTNVAEGTQNNAGSAVGTNAKRLIITNSTVQGVP